RFLDVLNRQDRDGSESTIEFDIAIRHHVVVGAAGDNRPIGILNVSNSQSCSRIDHRAIDPLAVQNLCPSLGIIFSNHIGSLVDDASSHAVKTIRRREEGIQQNLFSSAIGRLKVLEHDLVSFKDVPVSIYNLRSHTNTSMILSISFNPEDSISDRLREPFRRDFSSDTLFLGLIVDNRANCRELDTHHTEIKKPR